jgi:predicted AAA+ superfamily ATPase
MLSGPRQSGKTTLLIDTFPHYKYSTMSDIRSLSFASSDPKGFLALLGEKAIIDDIHKCATLIDYVKTEVKSNPKLHYILTSGYNYHLENTSTLTNMVLLPLSWTELSISKFNTHSLNDTLLRGGCPAVHKEGITNPTEFFLRFTEVFFQNDFSIVSRVKNHITLNNFCKTLANRIGDVLDISDVAFAAGITRPTALKWIRLLEDFMVIKLVHPIPNDFGRRCVKRPKIYFIDTGFAAALLRITTVDQLQFHPKKNAFFRSFLIAEKLKYNFAHGIEQEFWYYKDSTTTDVDVVFEEKGELYATGIIASATPNNIFHNQILRFASIAGLDNNHAKIIYIGKEPVTVKGIEYRPWRWHIIKRIRDAE